MDQGDARSKCKKTLFLVNLSPKNGMPCPINFFANRSVHAPRKSRPILSDGYFLVPNLEFATSFAAHEPASRRR